MDKENKGKITQTKNILSIQDEFRSFEMKKAYSKVLEQIKVFTDGRAIPTPSERKRLEKIFKACKEFDEKQAIIKARKIPTP